MNEKLLAEHPLVAAYLAEVCRHVKATDVHKDINQELVGHLFERVEDLMELEQLDEEEAIAAAIKAMGDAQVVGIGLDAAHQPKTEWSVLAIFVVMLVMAVVAIFVMPIELMVDVPYKLAIGFLGLMLMVAAYFYNYQRLARWSWVLFGITLASMFYVLLFGTEINGSREWLLLGQFGFNIIEVSPYFLIIAIAGILYRDQAWQHSSKRKLLINSCKKLIAFILLPLLVYVLIPKMVSLLIYMFGLFVLLLLYGRWRFILAASGTLIAGLLFLLLHNDSLFRRLYTRLTFMFSDDLDARYQAMRSIEAVHAGGLWGQGARVANPNIPFAHSEMLYTYLVYSLGWVVGIVLVLVALTFIFRTIQMGLKTTDRYGRALIIGICSIFGLRLLWNLLMCLGMVPIVGIAPPFLYLGSSSIIEFGLVGLILGVYRRKDMVSQRQGTHSAFSKL